MREISIHMQANEDAMKEIGRLKAHAMDEVSNELTTPEGERNYLYNSKAARQIDQIVHTDKTNKDEQGVVLWKHDKIVERWKGYYAAHCPTKTPHQFWGQIISACSA